MKINIVQSTLMGYKTVWEERHYVLKLALIPVLIKFVCTIAIYTLEIDILSLRHILIMLPSYFAQGWMIAQFLRTLLTGERWPIQISNTPTAEEIIFIVWRAQGILAGILGFVLIIMIQGGFVVFLSDIREALELNPNKTPSQGHSMLLMVSVALMVFMVWTFRLIWLYIPLVILAPVKNVLRDIRGFKTSLYMIGVWLMSTIPVMFILLLLSALFLESGQGSLTSAPSFLGFLTIFLHVIGEITSHILVATAMTYAFKNVLIKYGATPIFNEPDKPF